MIQSLVQEIYTFCVFGFETLVAKLRIRLDQNLVCELLLRSGTYLRKFWANRSSGDKTDAA
jgi:hypothetical protein